jgi:hypothetical protein
MSRQILGVNKTQLNFISMYFIQTVSTKKSASSCASSVS